MLTSALLKKLSYIELSNLSLSNGGSGAIIEDKIPAIIDIINDGLLNLYSNFCMSQKDLLIETVANISNYELSMKYAWSQKDISDVPHHYIIDHAEPFIGDVIRILSVYTTDGRDIPLNDVKKLNSVFTPSPIVLQVPVPDFWETIGVQYQASHPEIRVITDEISLPRVLEEPLRLYVAHKIFSGMGGQENSAKSMEFLQLFDRLCSDVELEDLVSTSVSTTNEKFHERGWV